MAYRRILTLRLDEQEFELLERKAREAGLYRHGFIKAALRIALGLPVGIEADSIQVPPARPK